eukprot:Skav228638  [mRNA]  locus=scaffold204:74010:88779:+ [translate_table: standard]
MDAESGRHPPLRRPRPPNGAVLSFGVIQPWAACGRCTSGAVTADPRGPPLQKDPLLRGFRESRKAVDASVFVQRAVPVLESGSLEETQQCVWSPDWPRNFKDDSAMLRCELSGLRWSSWAHDARGTLMCDTAMALPMSALADALARRCRPVVEVGTSLRTMTSGKRKTYGNRSTFQAHVCCVMDPEQVPKIMESLQKSQHLSSARSWPHACRILSPFDGQVHVCSEDDEDPGAGEKILGLLERMGLENLLLVVSHWNSGSVNRLGTELFKCVTEQCKELLKDLQQALRATFPPEELLLRSEAETLKDAETPQGSGTESLFGSDAGDDPCYDPGSFEQRHVDLRAIGATPPVELIHAAGPNRARARPVTGGPVNPGRVGLFSMVRDWQLAVVATGRAIQHGQELVAKHDRMGL